VAFKVEVIADRGVNRNEFLERLHTPKTPHCRLSSSKRQSGYTVTSTLLNDELVEVRLSTAEVIRFNGQELR
jgi:hypothetical protein